MRVSSSVVKFRRVGDGERGRPSRTEPVGRVEVAREQVECSLDDVGVRVSVSAKTVSDRTTTTRGAADHVDEVVGILGLAAMGESQRLEDNERRWTADRDRARSPLSVWPSSSTSTRSSRPTPALG